MGRVLSILRGIEGLALGIPSIEERLFSEGRDTLGIRRIAIEVDIMRIIRL
jgi:hypothetical protein